MMPEASGLESCSNEASSSQSSSPQSSHLQSISPKLNASPASQGRVRKNKMSLPRRIIRVLESSKRLHFQNVSLSKKRQMCINQCLPDFNVPSQSSKVPARQQISSHHTSTPITSTSRYSLTQCRASTHAVNNHTNGNSQRGQHNGRKVRPTSGSTDQGRTCDASGKDSSKEVVAIDCEMVGVGPKGSVSALARCSIVDYQGRTIYDQYIKPNAPITDYRTRWSGIRSRNMDGAISFPEAMQQVVNLLKDKIVIGHAVFNDFRALDNLQHPVEDTRDTSKCKFLVELCGKHISPGQHLGLKTLSKLLLQKNIQQGEHCSVEDALTTMQLYKLVEKRWEEDLESSFPDHQFRASFLDDHFWPDDL